MIVLILFLLLRLVIITDSRASLVVEGPGGKDGWQLPTVVFLEKNSNASLTLFHSFSFFLFFFSFISRDVTIKGVRGAPAGSHLRSYLTSEVTKSKNNMAAQKKNAGKTPPSIIEKNDKREIHNDIDSLNKKIELLEKIIEDKDYIIDDLVLERDQISDNRYAQRIKCESMQRQLTKATERIKELEKENKEKREAIADKDYIIDDLVLERDQISDDRYAQRIKCVSTQQQLTKACERIKVLEKEPVRVNPSSV